jgi:outer membrane immunogenic protein
MKRVILGVAAALFLSAGQAAADGLPSKGYVKGPDYSAAPNWNGFSVGLGVGASAAVTEIPGIDGIGGEGVFGTVALGYDRVLRPGFVAGVFADFDFGGAQTDIGPGSLDQNHSWAIGARLGVLTSASTLIYGTAGYTQTEFELSGPGISVSKTFGGYFLGGGVETFLRSNLTAKLEYRFSQYDGEELAPGADLEPSTHSVRAVVSFKFGDHRD